jgi:hypothetical protein
LQLSQLCTVLKWGIMVAKVGLEVVFLHCKHKQNSMMC